MDSEQEQPSCMSGTRSIMDEIPDYKKSMQADVEIYVAGAPCQPYSHQGKQEGNAMALYTSGKGFVHG